VLSPDASLVALDRWLALSAEQRRGARLGWLLIPAERADPLGSWQRNPAERFTPKAPIDSKVALEGEDLGDVQPL
jgi:hypothetical protein